MNLISKMLPRSPYIITLLLLTLAAFAPFNPTITIDRQIGSAWQSKVDPWVLQTARSGQTEFLILLNTQADLSVTRTLNSKQNRGQYVYRQLLNTAQETQPALLAELNKQGLDYRAFWLVNAVWARGTLADIQSIALRADVSHIYANPSVKLNLLPNATQSTIQPLAVDGIEWNIQRVGAPAVWAEEYTGQGTVVGGQDTGYDWDHEALINQYRGWDGLTANHDYSWHDAIHSNNPNSPAGNPCGFDSPIPCDDGYHGTHTMGTMVGDNGATKVIGMAPGAHWIGCRNMEQGWGTPATYIECYQWFIAPTRVDGSDPRPDLAPDVISNSWYCPPEEGCTDPNVLLTAVNNLRAAGIVTVQSAGNDGDNCETIKYPAGIYEASFTVGATDSSDNIAGFSSRGPVTSDGSNRLKPNVSAPGVSVYSSFPNNQYDSLSGTSMAAPHVAGLVALMISTNPALRGQVDKLEDYIEHNALPRTAPSQSCGGVPGTNIPNNTYGWGRIDAYATYQAIIANRVILIFPLIYIP